MDTHHTLVPAASRFDSHIACPVFSRFFRAVRHAADSDFGFACVPRAAARGYRLSSALPTRLRRLLRRTRQTLPQVFIALPGFTRTFTAQSERAPSADSPCDPNIGCRDFLRAVRHAADSDVGCACVPRSSARGYRLSSAFPTRLRRLLRRTRHTSPQVFIALPGPARTCTAQSGRPPPAGIPV